MNVPRAVRERGVWWRIALRAFANVGLALLPLIACAAPPTEGAAINRDHSLSIVEEGGVTVVVNRGGPRFHGELFAYEELVALRADPEEPESLLHFARSFTMDASTAACSRR